MKKSGFNYRREGDAYLIELKLATLQQLFNSLDPAPFREKDLNPAADEYLYESAAELPLEAPLKLVLHLPAELCGEEQAAGVPDAIHHYFAYRTRVTARQFSRTMAQGRKALWIGLAFLFACIIAHHAIASLGKSGLFWSVVEEGFLITGWVAMWRPIEIFLYDWWPIRRRRQLLEKLAQVPVELRVIGGAR